MTTGHLLLISIGPVQDFIAQARRTRDLWFGSHLLSELSRAAAKALTLLDAELIFPALKKGHGELEECDGPTRGKHGPPPLSIANKILVELKPGTNPATSAKIVRDAVKDRWRRIAGRVRAGSRHVLAKTIGPDGTAENIDDVWHEQIGDVVEFYAVWAVLRPDHYQCARDEVEQALAGRKNLRDFKPWEHDPGAAPKSSLDGARVSVLAKDRGHPDFPRLGIRTGEQLDAVGLVKRTGFDPEQFIPLVNVAAGEWLQRAAGGASGALDAARVACKAAHISKVERDLPVIKPFPFDASVLYPSRWGPLSKELPVPKTPGEAQDWGKKYIGPLLKAMKNEPPPYVACLVADGDHMGRAINTLATAEQNRIFSRALGEFPKRARAIVEDRYFGSLVYAGGDDVLAFLPAATALHCAKALAEKFHAMLAEALRTALALPVPPDDSPTLSVGIGIGHVLDPMSSLLQWGKDAERAAKDSGRNALAVIVDKRSGGQRRFARSWKYDPLKRIREDMALLDDKSLSTGKVHALEAMLNRFPKPDALGLNADTVTNPDAKAAAAAFIGYANDLLRHTGEGNADISLAKLGITEGPDDYKRLRTQVSDAIDRVLTVRLMREAGFDGQGT